LGKPAATGRWKKHAASGFLRLSSSPIPSAFDVSTVCMCCSTLFNLMKENFVKLHSPRRNMFAHPGISSLKSLLATAVFSLSAGLAFAQTTETPKLDVPYVPTPQPVVDKMLDLAKVGKNDVLIDLGCGDGRIVVTAAKERGARGTCVDINPVRIQEAKQNAKQAGVTDKVNFIQGDLFKADLSKASVVTLYLLPDINRKLRPQLWKQLEPGTRVVSHDFDMGPEWPPQKVEKVGAKTIYMWTITPENKKAVTEMAQSSGKQKEVR
jgi:protein-L-isoaspartate O-methyltransferase